MCRPVPIPVLLALFLVGCASTQTTPRAADRVPRQRSVDAYVAMLEADGRAAWQRPEELVGALRIEPGMRVADVGTGSGYFLPLLNDAVGENGEVIAQDIDSDLIEVVRERVRREGLGRVTPRLGRPDDPGLEEGAFDVILMVDVYHHVADPAPFLAHIRRALRPSGRLFVVDFPPGDAVPISISGTEHRIAPERVLGEARAAGFRLLHDHPDLLPHQFVLELSLEHPFGALEGGGGG